MTPKLSQARMISTSLASLGTDGSGLSAASLVRVRHGAHVLASEWSDLFSEGKLLTRADAVVRRQHITHGALSHATAGAAHRLSLYRVRHDRVEMIVPGDYGRRGGRDILRHHTTLPEEDVVVIAGVRVTSLERTVYDIIRSVSLEAAVVCFDAALRRVAWNDGTNTYDRHAAERFRARIWRRIFANSGARGIRRARFVAEFADGRAQLPGESISRLWMRQLGLAAPTLQRRVDFPGGAYALLDFAWPDQRRWAEFDGEAKYTDAEMLAGRSGDEVRAEQRRRQHRIEQATGWRCDRWGFTEMRTIDEFAQVVRALGLHS